MDSRRGVPGPKGRHFCFAPTVLAILIGALDHVLTGVAISCRLFEPGNALHHPDHVIVLRSLAQNQELAVDQFGSSDRLPRITDSPIVHTHTAALN